MNWCEIVESQEQSERVTCGVIIFSRDGVHVLLNVTESGFAFPCVEIPRWERLAENVTAALKRDWGCDAVSLFTPTDSSPGLKSNGIRYEVMECWRDGGHTSEAAWKPVPSLTIDSFQNEAEFRILEQCLYQLDCYGRDPFAPFARRGWLARLRDWSADIIRPLGLELTGQFRHYNSGPSFNLIRFETNGPAVWFKAVGEPNQREFPITLNLSQLFPQYLPKVLGTRPDWHGWLSFEVTGADFGKAQAMALWKRAAESLAKLQIESIGKTASILDTGAHDLRAETLCAMVRPFLAIVAQLMKQPTKVPTQILSQQELSLLGVRIEDSLTLLEDLQIPNALGHLDLNPRNIIVSADSCVFLDWAEAYVGAPFFSFEYLVQHFRREIGANAVVESQLIAAYKAPWRQLFSEDLISEALILAPLTAVFAYAAATGAWKYDEGCRDPNLAAYFRSLARRMNREAIRIIERRSPCLS